LPPTLSVLIPNLHCPRIGETVNAVLAQEGVSEPFEVIVVGRDRYGRIPADARVTFVETPRDFTPSEARNRAITEAKGSTLLFLDADCVPEPDWLRRMLAVHRETGAVVGGALTFDRDGYWSVADNISAAHGFLPSTPAGPPKGFHLSAASLCAEKADIVEAGAFDEALVCGEDFDLMIRLIRRGKAMHFEPTARAAHRHARRDLRGFVRHALAWAPDSVIVRQRHADLLGTPWFLGSPVALRLLSPVIGLGAALRIWLKHPELVRDLAAFPAVYAAKVLWCWAAAQGLGRRAETAE
jgi:glycosyltransferase involved in cell wall biosynthesis